jgi:hypothetical protein
MAPELARVRVYDRGNVVLVKTLGPFTHGRDPSFSATLGVRPAGASVVSSKDEPAKASSLAVSCAMAQREGTGHGSMVS